MKKAIIILISIFSIGIISSYGNPCNKLNAHHKCASTESFEKNNAPLVVIIALFTSAVLGIISVHKYRKPTSYKQKKTPAPKKIKAPKAPKPPKPTKLTTKPTLPTKPTTVKDYLKMKDAASATKESLETKDNTSSLKAKDDTSATKESLEVEDNTVYFEIEDDAIDLNVDTNTTVKKEKKQPKKKTKKKVSKSKAKKA